MTIRDTEEHVVVNEPDNRLERLADVVGATALWTA
jgi:hypothetical protein